MAERVEKLSRQIFRASNDLRDLWAMIRPQLANTRIEIITEIGEASAIPCELISDPHLKRPFVLSAKAFVRGQGGTVATVMPDGQEVEKD